MAAPAPHIPNMATVVYIFDNTWTMAQVEAYIVDYQPGGISLSTLRRALGYGILNPAAYAQNISKVAAILFTLGHTKTVHEVLLDLLHRVNPLRLTVDQVCFCLIRSLLFSSSHEWWKEGGGGGVQKFV